MINTILLWLGLLGFIGLLGLAVLKNPVEKSRKGGTIRRLGLLGFMGVTGFWIPGAGAIGAFGVLTLWNHQTPRYAGWAKLGVLGVLGVFALAYYLF